MPYVRTTLVLVALIVAQPVYATLLFCEGTIDRLYVDDTSRVFIRGSWRNDYTQICDLDGTWNGVSQEVCKTSWFPVLLTGFASKSTTLIRYSNAAASSCGTIATGGSAPKPHYVMLKN